MKGRIRILQSVGSLGLGGNEIFVMNLFRNIDKSEFQVDFVVFDDKRLDFYEEILASGSKVYFCTSRSNNKLICLLEQIKAVKKILSENDYDIIHCHSCSLAGLFRSAIPGFLYSKTKVITHSHNPGLPKNTFLDKCSRFVLKVILSKIIDYGFSCSDVAGESKYTKNFIKSNKYYLINNAINIDNYIFDNNIRERTRQLLGIEEHEFVIGHIGRFEYQKNHGFLVDIFEKIAGLNPDSKLLLVGDGSLFNNIKEKIRKLSLDKKVIFTGQQESAENYYQAMDCFVLPSYYEGFPFVLVEAQINGLRAVISDTISKSVNIANGIKFCSLNQNPNVWANIVIKFGNQRMGDEQVKIVCDLYDLKKEIHRIEGLYKKCIRNL
ncbi:MAG: glycosyltransferase [Lachnospiraceae bacterium]|nr:glycosyltransferase [Lachnospiraceae bacterium]